MKALTICILIAATACITASPAAERVRVTINPEVVRGCKLLGNVRATSGWSNSSGIAGNNTDVTLREKTAALGGDTVLLIESGAHAIGEAYRCEQPKP